MPTLGIGDDLAIACNHIDYLPLRPLTADANGKDLQYSPTTPAQFLHHAPLAILLAPSGAIDLLVVGAGAITGTYWGYQRYVDKDGVMSDLSPISNEVVAVAHSTVAYTNAPKPIQTEVVRRQFLRSLAGDPSTFYVDIDTDDLESTSFFSTRTDANLSTQTKVVLADLPIRGMDTIMRLNNVKVCNTLGGGSPVPWGIQHTPFHLLATSPVGCAPVKVNIDWVFHELDFGEMNAANPKKLPDRDFPDTIFAPLLYPFSFRNQRRMLGGNFGIPPILYNLINGKWFDEKSLGGDPDGIDEGIHFTEKTPILNDTDNTYVTFQARVGVNFHTQTLSQPFQNNTQEPAAWQNMRTLTCEEANGILGNAESATETDQWVVLGTNPGILQDNTGADPDLEPDGFAYLINIVYQYAIA